MKKCPECGQEVEDNNQIFCPICACRLEKVVSSVNYSNDNNGDYRYSSYKRKSKKPFIMIFSLIVIGLMIFGIVKCSSVPSGSAPFEVTEYKVGERGEAGIVFYDKGYYSDGWRYLECSKEEIINQPWDENDSYQNFDLFQEIGGGDYNTYKIINNLGIQTAAYVAKTYDGSGKDDWYLGNIKEMQLLFNNLVKDKGNRKKVDSYSDVDKLYTTLTDAMADRDTLTYLVSNMANEERCYTVIFSTGLGYDGGEPTSIGKTWINFINSYKIDHVAKIRPIRKF